MSDPDALRSIFEDPTDLEMDNLTKPNPILRLKGQLITLVYSMQASAQSWHFPLILSLLQQYPLWFPRFVCLHPIIFPSLPLFQTNPLFPSMSMTPKTISFGEDIMEVRRGMHFIRVEDRDDQLLLDHLLYGQHRSRIFNSSWPRSCDRS